MRLNLGAGNKPLPRDEGWVNVDLYPGDSLDHEWLQCDFNKTLLPAGVLPESVDEILASHIIEHFHPSRVPELLATWFSALKPGGFIALEQPDLIKCASNFLRGVASGEAGYVTQFGLWGFYGNSRTLGDGMQHYWGYWPASLRALLEDAGFVGIHEVAPRVKPWASQRDFRLEAVRPIREES